MTIRTTIFGSGKSYVTDPTNGAAVSKANSDAAGQVTWNAPTLAGTATAVFSAGTALPNLGTMSALLTTSSTDTDSSYFSAAYPATQTEMRRSVYVTIPTVDAAGTCVLAQCYVDDNGAGGTQVGAVVTVNADYSIKLGALGVANMRTLPAACVTPGQAVRIDFRGKVSGTGGSDSYVGIRVLNLSTGAVIDAPGESSVVAFLATKTWRETRIGKCSAATGTPSRQIALGGVRSETGPRSSEAWPLAEAAYAPSASPTVCRVVPSAGTISPSDLTTQVANLGDNSAGTTIVATSTGTLTLSLTPLAFNALTMPVTLKSVSATASTTATARLINSTTATQVGTDKTVSIGTTPADVTVTWPQAELDTVSASVRDGGLDLVLTGL